MLSAIRADKHAVSRLISVLQSLKTSDEGFPDANEQERKARALETIASLKNLQYWSDSPEIVTDARKILQGLKNIEELLADLSASLEGTIMHIKTHIEPFELGMGLASIPDDILTEIFEYGLDSYDKNLPLSKETLSLVCRRFRRVVLNTPRLWSHISSNDKIPYVRACLERSKSVGLSISLNLTDADDLDRELSLLVEVIPYSSRWEHLSVRFSLEDVDITHHESALKSTIASNLHLPSLQSLSLLYSIFREEDNLLANDHIMHFYQSWDVPNLRSLYSSEIPRTFIAPKLSSVDLCLIHSSGGPAASERLRDFFTAFPELEELNLGFSYSGARGYPSSHLDLPNLTTLCLGAFHCDPRDVRPFMEALQAPRLRSLEINMSVSDDYDYDESQVLHNFFPLDVYPALEDLSIIFLDETPMNVFHLTFEKIPGLHTLSLDTSNFFPSVPYNYLHVPPLRTLKIANCSNIHLPWLENLRKQLIERGLWEGFKTLEVPRASTQDSSLVHWINTSIGEENKDIVWS